MKLIHDKQGVFRINHRGEEHQLTQFGRALDNFDIELIFAKTPQAEGTNKTLQDRLVKALRLANIITKLRNELYYLFKANVYSQRILQLAIK